MLVHERDPDLLGIGRRAQDDVLPEDVNVARLWSDRPAQHLHEGGFAGAVLANDADDLSGKNGK